MTELPSSSRAELNAFNSSLRLSFTYRAPRDRVFQAWIEPEQLAQWWGAKGYTLNVKKLELRPGGVFHYNQQSPDGQVMWGKYEYREVVAPDRLVFTNAFSNEAGETIRPPFIETWPLLIKNTLTFAEQNGITTLVLIGVPYEATAAEHAAFKAVHDGVKQGLAGTLAQLKQFLKSEAAR